MKFHRFLLAGALVPAVFLSCATTGRSLNRQPDPVYVTNTQRFSLLPPDCLDAPFEAELLLSGRFGKNAFVLRSFLQLTGDTLLLSLFNDFGTGLGTLLYDGASVSFESNIFSKGMKAEYIVADLQFAYYRAERIRHALEAAGIAFTVERTADSEIRTLKSGGILIEEIIKSAGTVTVKNHLRNYEYTLQAASE